MIEENTTTITETAPNGAENGEKPTENIKSVENAGETQTAEQKNVGENGAPTAEDKNTLEKTFTQEEVNNLIRERLERQKSSFFKKYELKDESEIGSLVGMQQAYSVMKERYEKGKADLINANQNNAFLKLNIADLKKNDVIAYFKGTGQILNEENLAKEITTHPEWLKQTAPQQPQVEILGADHEVTEKGETPEQKRKRIFGY